MAKESKNFDSIAEDYAFFETHATEAEQDLKACRRHCANLFARSGEIDMLDFGGGTGNFTAKFLANADTTNLRLFLVEPGETNRLTAVARLRGFTNHPILHWPTLPQALNIRFDLILASHVFYYVPELEATLDRLSRCLRPSGLFLLSMSGRDNALFTFWREGFASISREIPYSTAEDVEQELMKLELPFIKDHLNYTIEFIDTHANRIKILRFLFGDYFETLTMPPLLDLFTPYASKGNIRIDTVSYLYVIKPLIDGDD